MVSKIELRERMRFRRDSLTAAERIEKSQQIAKRLFALPEFQKAKTVAFFLSIGSEVNTRWMIERALRLKKKVLVPVTKKEVELVEFPGWEDLKPGKFGVPEPVDAKPGTRNRKPGAGKPGVIIVPGLAFDRRGNRLGYGKGYYDRLLRELKTIRIGIAFGCQIVGEVPAGKGDERMDYVVTENETVKTNGRSSRY